MRQTGGVLAITASIFCVFAALGTAYLIDSREAGFLYALGGLVMAFFAIVPAWLILGTGGRTQPIILIITCLVGIAFRIGGGFVVICLAFAMIGGIMALFDPRPIPH